ARPRRRRRHSSRSSSSSSPRTARRCPVFTSRLSSRSGREAARTMAVNLDILVDENLDILVEEVAANFLGVECLEILEESDHEESDHMVAAVLAEQKD
ncbi:unnamed protein product, partial [Urochloa humidicola]